MIRPSSEWEDLSEWWVAELDGDPAYSEEIEPLVLALLQPRSGQTYLDVGSGEGRLMRTVSRLGARVVGVDLLHELLVQAPLPGVRLRLPSLACLQNGSVDGAYICLVVEHLEDEEPFLAEVARVVKPDTPVVLVINHPYFTAPGSAPIQEPDEILWRPGSYLDRGMTEEPVGQGTVRFYHRPVSSLLTSAARAGLHLERMVEIGVSEGQVLRTPVLDGQRHIPRLLGVRWTRSSISSAPVPIIAQ
jgi:SAM-dependent methyltransferase